MKSILGKLWNLPNTLIGLLFGGLGVVLSLGKLNVTFGNNAIQFHDHPLCGLGAITLGNVICYGSGLPETAARPEGGSGNVGDHERQHTFQGEWLGPLYLPSHVLSLIAGSMTGNHHGHANWNERGPQNDIPSPWLNSRPR